MGRPRKPTNLLHISGAFKKHPERQAARANEPLDIPEIGAAPAHLTLDQQNAWKYIVDRCAAGVLRRSDEVAVEICARLLAKMWAGPILPPELKQLDTLLGKFGMNPSERSKVSAGAKPKENKFASIG